MLRVVEHRQNDTLLMSFSLYEDVIRMRYVLFSAIHGRLENFVRDTFSFVLLTPESRFHDLLFKCNILTGIRQLWLYSATHGFRKNLDKISTNLQLLFKECMEIFEKLSSQLSDYKAYPRPLGIAEGIAKGIGIIRKGNNTPIPTTSTIVGQSPRAGAAVESSFNFFEEKNISCINTYHPFMHERKKCSDAIRKILHGQKECFYAMRKFLHETNSSLRKFTAISGACMQQKKSCKMKILTLYVKIFNTAIHLQIDMYSHFVNLQNGIRSSANHLLFALCSDNQHVTRSPIDISDIYIVVIRITLLCNVNVSSDTICSKGAFQAFDDGGDEKFFLDFLRKIFFPPNGKKSCMLKPIEMPA